MDFENMTCQQLWDFIEDPANSPLDRTSALSVWQARCWDGIGSQPTSGGTIPPHPPAH